MMRMRLPTGIAACGVLAALMLAGAAAGAQAAAEEDLPKYKVEPSGVEMLKIGLPRAEATPRRPAPPSTPCRGTWT